MPGRKFKSRTTAPAIVTYTKARNEQLKQQLCVFVECTYGGTRYGPVWGHTAESVRAALAMLTRHCDCGRPWHKARFFEGVKCGKTGE